jgi:putative hydrolase of the HAD superfamily
MNSENNPNPQALLFDYGGTLDTNGRHWSEVLWDAYLNLGIPISKTNFRQAYIYAERRLAESRAIQPGDTFLTLLKTKTAFQIQYLIDHGFLKKNKHSAAYPLMVSNQCYTFAQIVSKNSVKVLQILANRFPLGLVSNFYGNLETVLDEFGMRPYFQSITESARVKVRKPDPAIFRLALHALGTKPETTALIGDSYTNDIAPAHALGCQTIWLKNTADNAPLAPSLPPVPPSGIIQIHTLNALPILLKPQQTTK